MVLLSGFLIWTSVVLMTYAYTVEVDVNNAVHVIQSLIINKSDWSTWSVLNWDNIKTYSLQTNFLCNESGSVCINIPDIAINYMQNYFSGDVIFDNGSIFIDHNLYVDDDMYWYGNVYISGHINASHFCDENWQNCKDMIDILTGFVELDPIFSGWTAGKYCTYNWTTISCEANWSVGGSSDNFYLTGWFFNSGSNTLTLYISGSNNVTWMFDDMYYTTGISDNRYYTTGELEEHFDGYYTTWQSDDRYYTTGELEEHFDGYYTTWQSDSRFIPINWNSTISGNITISGTLLSVRWDIGINQYLKHNDDANTYLDFQNDLIDFYIGWSSYFVMDWASSQKQIIMNNSGIDLDFVVNW